MTISKKARKQIIFLLYRHFLLNDNDKDFLDWVYLTFPNEDIKFYLPLLKDIIQKKDKIINIINLNLVNWVFLRLGFVEQAILLFSCYEMIYLKNNHLIVINEAVKLAKKYCEKKSYGFINSILDKTFNFVII